MPSYRGIYSQLDPAQGEPSPRASARSEGEDSLTLTNEKNLQSCAQVGAVRRKCDARPECDANATQSVKETFTNSANLKKDSSINLRMKKAMREAIDRKAAALEMYPSAYCLAVLARDLGQPDDEYTATRNAELKAAWIKLKIAFDDIGTLFNQMARATNRGAPCPLPPSDIALALKKYEQGCSALESFRPK
jgi:hypothetical protein